MESNRISKTRIMETLKKYLDDQLAQDIFEDMEKADEYDLRHQAGMKYGEWKNKIDCDSVTLVWAADTPGGFGRKGWGVYGECDDLTIVQIDTGLHGKKTLHLWDTDHWGWPDSYKQNENQERTDTIKIETKTNGYKAEALQPIIAKFEKVAADIFPGCTISHFYYGDSIDMVDLIVRPGDYAHFHIYKNSVRLNGYCGTDDDVAKFKSMTHGDELFDGKLMELADR